MSQSPPLTVLCITSYEKGQDFMRECKRQGSTVLLLTVEKLRHANWPFEALDETYHIPSEMPLKDVIHAVSYLARTQKLDRIVSLDEFDMETAAALREHLRVPGMGLTTLRYFRDKLAMRAQAQEQGILVPPFVPIIHYDDIRNYMRDVAPPWVLKPRSEASAIGIKKIHAEGELWPILDALGDKQSFYLLEQFIPGEVFHVDGIVSERKAVFATVSKYGKPPMKVAHEGGIFTTHTLPRTSHDFKALQKMNADLMKALGMVRGVTHSEFIKADKDHKFYFLESAARVGGAYITQLVEASTGVNLWVEWAKIELAGGKQPYKPPKAKNLNSGVILCLAKQEHPDTSGYKDPEVHSRLSKHHHAGLLLLSHKAERVAHLLDAYSGRFAHDFMAVQPLPEKPTS